MENPEPLKDRKLPKPATAALLGAVLFGTVHLAVVAWTRWFGPTSGMPDPLLFMLAVPASYTARMLGLQTASIGDFANNPVFEFIVNTAQKHRFIGSVDFFEDDSRQHAVDIKIGVSGEWWDHVPVCDRTDKRIRIIKCRSSGYRS